MSRSPMRTLRQKLPVLPVPLTTDHEDVLLDLQAVFERIYNAGPFQKSIDYPMAPVPPLRPEDKLWAEALLQKAVE